MDPRTIGGDRARDLRVDLRHGSPDARVRHRARGHRRGDLWDYPACDVG